MAKVHFRDYNPKQIILFPQRLDKDIAENDPRPHCRHHSGYDINYKRFRHFGMDKVKMDFAFFAIAFNIKKKARESLLEPLIRPISAYLRF